MLRPLMTMLVIVSLAPLVVAQEATATDKQLRQLLDQVWDFELTESPMLATNVGDPAVKTVYRTIRSTRLTAAPKHGRNSWSG